MVDDNLDDAMATLWVFYDEKEYARFFARYERVRRSNLGLGLNVRVARTRTIGPGRCRQQRGRGMVGHLLKSGLKIGSKLFKLAVGQKIIEGGIKNAPNIYSTGVKRVSNKRIKRALESDLANYAVKSVQKELYNWQNA